MTRQYLRGISALHGLSSCRAVDMWVGSQLTVMDSELLMIEKQFTQTTNEDKVLALKTTSSSHLCPQRASK